MCSIASVRESTTLTAARRARNSRPKSSGSAGRHGPGASVARRISTVRGQPRISTGGPDQRRASCGMKYAATASCTRTVSSVLQTDGRRVLALSTMASAMSRSASPCTYVWQTPRPPATTGTCAFSRTNSMSVAPPRGTIKSIWPRIRTISPMRSDRDRAPSARHPTERRVR